MVEIRHLARAPITEAVIDLRVKFPANFQAEQLFALKDKLKDRLPKIEEKNLFKHEFGISNGKPIPSITEPKGLHGLSFRSEEGMDIAQCRIDGLTFSRLKPYKNWEYLFNEANHFWNLYQSTVSPELITRIAVRYINHIKLSLPINDFSRFFTAPLPVPAGHSRPVNSFLTRVLSEEPEHQVISNVIQALERNVDENSITIILDIDVFKIQDYDVNDDRVWSMLNTLKNIKNQIFFESITDETVRLFE